MRATLAANRVAVEVTATPTVDDATSHRLWRLYRDSFAELRSRAATRHVFSRSEFQAHLDDPQVDKLVAWLDGQPVGLVTLTRNLHSVPWVSPEFYGARYPEQAARGAIFYCALAMVHPFARRSDAFARLVARRAPDIVAADGVLAADLCSFNIEETELSDTMTVLMRRAWGGARLVELDRQVFFAWEPQPSRLQSSPGVPQTTTELRLS